MKQQPSEKLLQDTKATYKVIDLVLFAKARAKMKETISVTVFATVVCSSYSNSEIHSC